MTINEILEQARKLSPAERKVARSAFNVSRKNSSVSVVSSSSSVPKIYYNGYKVSVAAQETIMSETSKVPPTLQALRARREDILSIAAQHGAYNLRVFGSVARGEATPDSDIDILAEFHPHTLTQRIALMQQLSELLNYQVEVIPEKSLRPHVRPHALREAIPL